MSVRMMGLPLTRAAELPSTPRTCLFFRMAAGGCFNTIDAESDELQKKIDGLSVPPTLHVGLNNDTRSYSHDTAEKAMNVPYPVTQAERAGARLLNFIW